MRPLYMCVFVSLRVDRCPCTVCLFIIVLQSEKEKACLVASSHCCASRKEVFSKGEINTVFVVVPALDGECNNSRFSKEQRKSFIDFEHHLLNVKIGQQGVCVGGYCEMCALCISIWLGDSPTTITLKEEIEKRIFQLSVRNSICTS